MKNRKEFKNLARIKFEPSSVILSYIYFRFSFRKLMEYFRGRYLQNSFIISLRVPSFSYSLIQGLSLIDSTMDSHLMHSSLKFLTSSFSRLNHSLFILCWECLA